ncbi:DUF5956 family protein [Arthrobacter psychrochitiniphilus]|uniref:Uncharacterized protein n=1 Tax=Arthrobacter psychrochitiniphilus TaxID=291045 RepID=A0A2V3DUU1_9MICC|nr:DUF5956 family protein [Arthrobacter psychrochitiniphilus]NYG15563.1 hypothetical protein [Arthrobacter psychrochitiniphilus]PXA66942.1 hypothetical protein CVS29_05175 [Arthrobacter psychrochitiniphilus]
MFSEVAYWDEVSRWDTAAFEESADGWELLGENGWFAMMAWAAGPGNTRKAVQCDWAKTVRVTCHQGETATTRAAPFTPEDRCTIEDSVNEYLLAAGIPARPSGFDWFLRVPTGWPEGLSLADELAARITGKWENGAHPATLRPLFREVVQDFYADAAS